MTDGIQPGESGPGPPPERPRRGCLFLLTLLLLAGVAVVAVWAFGTPALTSPFGTRFWRLVLQILLVLLGLAGLLFYGVGRFRRRGDEDREE
jgi:hypothetical protein